MIEDVLRRIAREPIPLLVFRAESDNGTYRAAVRAIETGLISPNGYGQLVLTDAGREQVALLPKESE